MFPPTITSQPSNQTVNVGDTATFSVTATGTPSPTYQWYKDGGLMSGETGSTLTITNSQLSDAGSYYVIVTNAAGTQTSSTVSLTVSIVSPPSISTFSPNRTNVHRNNINRSFKPRIF
jgi:hypothetical protein